MFKGTNCATHTFQYQARGVSCFTSRQFSLWALTRDCVLFRFSFHPPTLPPRVILCDVIECQRSLLGISLAFVYCWFVFLINFSLCQKRELCFICVRRRSWEFNIIMVCSSEGKYPSGVFELDCNLFKVLPCSQLTPWYPDLQLHVYPPFLGAHVAPCLQGLLTLHTSS